MRVLFAIILSLILFNNSVCQKYNHILFTSSFKPAPVYLNGLEMQVNHAFPLLFNQDKQLSGLEVGVIYRIELSKLGAWLDINTQMKYDHLYYDVPVANPQVGNSRSIRSPFVHSAFDLSKGIKTKNSTSFLSIGYGIYNIGSELAYTMNIGPASGPPLYISKEHSFMLSAFRLGIGCRLRNYEMVILAHISDQHNYFQPSRLLLLEFSMRKEFVELEKIFRK